MAIKEYLIIDGYNIINAWKELKEAASTDLEHARSLLIDIMRNYQGYHDINIIIVFDAHMANEKKRKSMLYGDVKVVFTKGSETADEYIERMVNDMAKDNILRVATSDFLEQTIVLSRGGVRISARELYNQVLATQRKLGEEYLKEKQPDSNTLSSHVEPGVLKKLEKLRRQS